jgi:hypothetical protein
VNVSFVKGYYFFLNPFYAECRIRINLVSGVFGEKHPHAGLYGPNGFLRRHGFFHHKVTRPFADAFLEQKGVILRIGINAHIDHPDIDLVMAAPPARMFLTISAVILAG